MRMIEAVHELLADTGGEVFKFWGRRRQRRWARKIQNPPRTLISLAT